MEDGPDTGYQSWNEDGAWSHEMSDEPEQPEQRDYFLVHDSNIEVALEPLDGTTPLDIFLEMPGAIVIRDKATSAEIRVNLGQCIGLIEGLTKMWSVSYYG